MNSQQGQGKGSFVRPSAPLIRLGNDRYSPRHRETGLSPFLLECAKQGKTGPVHRVTTYIPWSVAKGTGLLQEEVPHQFGIHGVLEEQHHVMTRIHEEVSVMCGDMTGLLYNMPAE